ncbi:MAG: DUF2079 domain-containing protein [Candidatus Bathyarchaeia archaeon]
MALIYIIIVSSLGIMDHYSFYTNAWDLGAYAQALYSTLNGKLLYYTVESVGNPSRSLFGIHFTPFLLLLVPIYAVYQNPIILLVLRPVAISLGLIPLYLILSMNDISKRRFVIVFAIIYLVYPPTLTPISNFDVLAFLPALFLFALYYFEKRNYLRAYLFILLSLMINEFVSLIVVATAIYVLLADWRKNLEILKRKKVNSNIIFSIALLLTGVLWFILASSVITYFNPAALRTKWEWGELGSGPGEIILSVLINPSKALNALLNDGQRKFLYIVALLGPLAFTSLLEPLALIMALPWLAASLLSINPLYYSVETQYPAFVSPFIFFSAIKGIRKIINFNTDLMKRIVTLMVIMILLSVLLIPSTVHLKSNETRDIIWLALSEIPPNASVSIMPDIYPHVCNRLEVYPYFVEGVDYVLVNIYSWWYDVILPRPAHVATRWCDAQISDDYGIVLNMKGVILYKRGYNGPAKYFSGVNFYYGVYDVVDSSGEVISPDTLIHRAGNPSLLFFKTPTKYLPPGNYNVTARLKVSSPISGVAIRFEIRTKPGEIKMLIAEFSGSDLSFGDWRDLSFNFAIKRPMPVEIAVYADNSTDIYFQHLNILQYSGV